MKSNFNLPFKAEKAAMRGLNDLRLKARVSLEETAQQFRERGREGDRMKALKYVNYARDVQNWGRQAAEEGAALVLLVVYVAVLSPTVVGVLVDNGFRGNDGVLGGFEGDELNDKVLLSFV